MIYSYNYYWFFSFIFFFLFLKYFTYPLNFLDNFYLRFKDSAFPNQNQYEYLKFPFIRILFGLIITIRGYYVFIYLLDSEVFSILGFYAIAEIVCGIFLITGFLSQWALLFLIFIMWQVGDRALQKITLGNDIAAMLAVFLFIINSGKYYSLDSTLIKKFSFLNNLLLYFKCIPNNKSLFYTKITAIFSYWCICLYSCGTHLNESAWLNGSAGPLLLTNNFMARYHNFFVDLFINNEFLIILARYSLWIMIFWYLFIFPFVLLGGFFRKFIIYWGVLFFLLSLFHLQLGWLAEIEFLLWIALFYIPKRSEIDGISILYDDKCSLCDKTIRFIKIIDIFRIVNLKPISTNNEFLIKYKLSKHEALSDIHGISPGRNKIFKGYDLYLELSKKLMILWIIMPILTLGKFLRIGPNVYNFIAKRRIEMFGVCKIPTSSSRDDLNKISDTSFFHKLVFIHVLFLSIFYILSIPAPFINHDGYRTLFSRAAHIYGLAPINVFNHIDLKMTENWFQITSINNNEILPIFSKEGDRLDMHKSDRIYFGHTLKYRRLVIDKNKCNFSDHKNKIHYLSKVYLKHNKSSSGNYKFLYTQYYQAQPDKDKIVYHNIYKKNKISVMCEETFEINFKN